MGIKLKRKQYIAFLAVISCILIFVAGWRLKVINSPDTRQQTAGENYAADLEDGSYTPDKFGFTGGTGRVELSCPEVVVRDMKELRWRGPPCCCTWGRHSRECTVR